MTSKNFNCNTTGSLIVLLLFLAGISNLSLVLAESDDSLEAFDVCEDIENDSDQLACFRDVLARMKRKESMNVASPSDEATNPQGRQFTAQPGIDKEVHGEANPMPEIGLYENGQKNKNQERAEQQIERPAPAALPDSSDEPAEQQELHGTIVEVRRTTFGKVVATLDNGQIWRETDGSHYRGQVRAGSKVIISRRPFGGFQMKIGEQAGVVLVRRTK